MKRLGISIYPEFGTINQDLKYIQKAHEKGFSLLFIAFLALEGTKEEIINRYSPITIYAKKLNFEIICDVNPKVFKKFGVNASIFNGAIDLSFFEELKIDVLRLDTGLSELEEMFLSKNKSNIKICLNAATSNNHIQSLIDSGAIKSNIVGCYNYYPHRYTGVSEEYFAKTTNYYKKAGVRCMTFVHSLNPDAFGPWPIIEGMPTLEMHRDLPLDIQIQHYKLLNLCDDYIISNCYATDEELESMAKLINNSLTLHITLVDGLSDDVLDLLKIKFSRRGERNDYLIRTIESRIKKIDVKPFNTLDICKGDVLIDNNLYGQYAGELQIALKDMKNSGKTNVIGKIVKKELFLLDLLEDNNEFCFEIIK